MTLNFALNVPTTPGRTATVREYSDEFIGEFVDAWSILSVQPKGSSLSVEFADADARNKWFDDAKAYGASFETPVHIRRIKGTGSMLPEHGKLTFSMETMDEHAARIAEKKEAVDTTPAREWLRTNGHEVSNRGRVPAHLMAKYNARPQS